MPFAFPSTANKEVFSFFSGFLEEESMEQGVSYESFLLTLY